MDSNTAVVIITLALVYVAFKVLHRYVELKYKKG